MENFQINSTIKTWAEDDRPREKLLNLGRANLSDAELVAIVLGSGTRNKSAVELAQEILQTCGNNLYQLGKMNLSELTKFKGVGEAKAVNIMAVLELGRRRAATEVPLPPKINQAAEAYRLMKPHFQDLEHEEFRVLGLTRSNRWISHKLISKGGRTGTVADGKLIFKELIDMKAAACLLFHNHPSGKLEPSPSDISLTRNLTEFGKLIDLPVLDHIIVADTGFYSFAEHGKI
ncbi:MAG TPA: DNA repair protein RadC [Brumimicrobium sp.]|nr:DNA repair protein RadC [Brumimicrobium sp.]